MVSSLERNLLRFTASLVLLAALAPFAFATPSFNSSTPWNAVPTFHSLGLYWKPTSGAGTQSAAVRFRPQGTTQWRDGLDLWWDERNDEYRGSLVELQPNTVYEIQLKLGSGTWTDTSASCDSAGANECAIPPTSSCSEANWNQCTRSWNENFPVAGDHTVTVPAGITRIVVQPTTAVTPTGSTSGTTYTVNAPTASGSYTRITSSNTIVGSTSQDACVEINHGTQKVIVSGLKLESCTKWGVHFNIGTAQPGTRDVVIDDNEIVGWGDVATNNVGAIDCRDSNPNPSVPPDIVKPHRIVIQNNNIHSPRHGSNAWVSGHPDGPQGVYFSRCGGNHVIRYNDVHSENGNHFNDAIGGCCNFETQADGFDDNVGFPGFDSDIYGNRISHAFDDAIEAEGPNRNVRIWANYVDRVFLPIGNVVTRNGPLYVWRNVSNNLAKMRDPNGAADTDGRPPFIKGGNKANNSWTGRAYYFHNTVLQPPKELCGGVNFTCGAGDGLDTTDGNLFDFVSKNNTWQVHSPGGRSIDADCTLGFCEANNDLFNGRIVNGGTNPETNGWGNVASGDYTGSIPTYAAGGGSYPQASAIPGEGNNWSGDFRLQAGTKGTGPDGTKFVAPIPNFNDLETQPHVGAQPASQALMKFGRRTSEPQCTQPPTASFTATPQSGNAPLQVAFDASASSAVSPATITAYSITYGDGGSGTGVTQSHTYVNPGNYTATLVVTDSNNCQSAPATSQIAVTDGGPAFRAAASGSFGPGIGFRAASSAATNTSSLSVNRPAGTAVNDVMIASISARPSSATIAAPAGWVLVRRVDNGSGQTISLAVFRKVAGAGEPASYTWNVSGATWSVGGIQSFSNVDPVNPIDVEGGQATPAGFTHATPSITTTVANAIVVSAHTFATSTTWTPPAGMTEAYDAQFQPVTTNQGSSMEGNYVLQAAAGATGTKTATAAGGAGAEDHGATHILALRPGAAVLGIEKPAGTTENDVLIASISARPSSATIAAPAGWVLVRRVDNAAGATTSLAVFRKVAGAAEPSSYAWDVSGATWAVGGIQSFLNVDTANPIDVENGQATSAGLTHATPSVTTTVAHAMVVTSHAFATSTTWTPPAGMTEAFDVQFQPVATNQGQSIEGNYVRQAAAGATGTKTATAAGGSGAEDHGATHILGLRPAAP